LSGPDLVRKQRLRFSRRVLLVGAGEAALFGVLGWRLRQLQILDSSEYRLLSDENRISAQLVAPARGTLYDRFGTRIAENRENLRVIVVPAFSKDLAATLTTLSSIVTVSDADKDRVLRHAKRQSLYLPILVAEGLTWRQFALLNVLAPQLPGVQTDMAQVRTYSHSRSMAHAVGYVGMAAKGEVEGEPVTRLPGFRIGKTGLEKGFDRELRGRPGSISYEVDAHGRVVRELGATPSTPGKDVVLSLDHELQEMVLTRLASQRRASLVALDAVTGAVLIMASTPTFDANEIAFNVDPKRWQELIRDKEDPLNNRAARGLYPPGSTFKVVTALAGLTAGVSNPTEKIICRGGFPFGNHYFHCWRSGGHGPISLHDAIKQSCDVYFYETAHRLGIDRLAVTGRALGLGQTYPCELAGLKGGVMPDTAWKRATLEEPWYPGETISCGIGQGYVLASPLQLAVMTARIATGNAVVPSFSCSNPPRATPAAVLSGIAPEHLQLVRDGMSAVVNEGGGTANGAALTIPGMLMAGKTGTSQTFGHDSKRHPTGWEAEPHSLFIAFAPVEAPRYAVACVVEHGGYGSRAAAPIIHDVMTELLLRDPVAKPVFAAGTEALAALAPTESGR
jgi:penicillin-binding protein 2